MAANNYQFVQTRDMFCEYLTGYPKNPTFEEWNSADADDKACLLYVKFYQEITLAWYNAVVAPKNRPSAVYVSQEDGVSTVLQYLMKNVEKISQDSQRYTAEYVYTVCYKCLLSLCTTRGTDAQRAGCEYPYEFTEELPTGTMHLNVETLIPAEEEDFETQQVREAIWNVIQHMGPKAEKVVNHIINPKDTLHKIKMSSPERPGDRLADISVNEAEYKEIVEELKVKLAPYKDFLLSL